MYLVKIISIKLYPSKGNKTSPLFSFVKFTFLVSIDSLLYTLSVTYNQGLNVLQKYSFWIQKYKNIYFKNTVS